MSTLDASHHLTDRQMQRFPRPKRMRDAYRQKHNFARQMNKFATTGTKLLHYQQQSATSTHNDYKYISPSAVSITGAQHSHAWSDFHSGDLKPTTARHLPFSFIRSFRACHFTSYGILLTKTLYLLEGFP